MAAGLDTMWTVVAPGFAWRFWDDEYIVFNRGSGDTHLLDRLAGETLRLIERAPADGRQLTHRIADVFDLEPDADLESHVEGLLGKFQALGLIQPAQP